MLDNGTRVMVVEDNEVERATLAELLRLWGYETETASDGLEALEKIPAFHPRVVISDLQMPRLGGIELLAGLRGSLPDVGCIIITGCASPEKADALTELGVLDYLEKPVDLERLQAGLRRCLHSASTEARSHSHNPARTVWDQAA